MQWKKLPRKEPNDFINGPNPPDVDTEIFPHLESTSEGAGAGAGAGADPSENISIKSS